MIGATDEPNVWTKYQRWARRGGASAALQTGRLLIGCAVLAVCVACEEAAAPAVAPSAPAEQAPQPTAAASADPEPPVQKPEPAPAPGSTDPPSAGGSGSTGSPGTGGSGSLVSAAGGPCAAYWNLPDQAAAVVGGPCGCSFDENGNDASLMVWESVAPDPHVCVDVTDL